MKKATLKQLAGLTLENGVVNDAVQRYALTRLSKADLKKYLFYLKNEIRQQRVEVRMPGIADAQTQKTIAAFFPGKTVQFTADAALGAGLQIEYDDNLVNLNLRNLILKTIGQVKEKL